MSPELIVRSEPDPNISAEAWQLPPDAIEELTQAVLARRTTTVTTEDAGFTGYGISPMGRRITHRFGVLTEVEPGRLVMEVESGLTVTQVGGNPNVDTAHLLDNDKGHTVIPVFREFRGWEEQTRGGERDDEAEKDDTVTSTEYIASVAVEGGRKFNFYPPPSHLDFP